MKPLAWPFVATVLLVVGTVAWCLSLTRGPMCECMECGLPAPKGVMP